MYEGIIIVFYVYKYIQSYFLAKDLKLKEGLLNNYRPFYSEITLGCDDIIIENEFIVLSK